MNVFINLGFIYNYIRDLSLPCPVSCIFKKQQSLWTIVFYNILLYNNSLLYTIYVL